MVLSGVSLVYVCGGTWPYVGTQRYICAHTQDCLYTYVCIRTEFIQGLLNILVCDKYTWFTQGQGFLYFFISSCYEPIIPQSIHFLPICVVFVHNSNAIIYNKPIFKDCSWKPPNFCFYGWTLSGYQETPPIFLRPKPRTYI